MNFKALAAAVAVTVCCIGNRAEAQSTSLFDAWRQYTGAPTSPATYSQAQNACARRGGYLNTDQYYYYCIENGSQIWAVRIRR